MDFFGTLSHRNLTGKRFYIFTRQSHGTFGMGVLGGDFVLYLDLFLGFETIGGNFQALATSMIDLAWSDYGLV